MPLDTSNIDISTHWLTNVVEINRRIKDTLEKSVGISVTQYRVLLELYANRGQLACGTLATLLFLSPAAVTRAVDELCRNGLATRTVMETNRRVVLVDSTAAGAQLLRSADEELVAMLRRDAWSDLTPEQHHTLVSSCSAAVGPFVGHTLLHGGVPLEPCYITCAIIQQRCYDSLLAEYGLTLNEFRTGILALDSKGGLRSSDVADALLLNRSTTSRAITALKEKGLLEGEVSKRDGRSSLLTLTSKGRATISEAFERMVALDRSICVNPNTAQIDEQNMLSEHVHAALQEASARDRG